MKRYILVLLFSFVSLQSAAMTAYDFKFKKISGGSMPLSKYKGKVLLVVNTASKCGYTPQYKQLQELYSHYQKDGLVVIGIPSEDFKQEFPDPNEVLSFATKEYAVSFPLTSINHVQSINAHPFYKWAYSHLGDAAIPKWNFHKLLINRKGELVAAFSTQEEPMSTTIINAVHKEINR